MELSDAIRTHSRSARSWTRLRDRIDALESGLGITAAFVPASQADVDRLHAYRVLAHAEFESYIEALASKIMDVTEMRMHQGKVTHAGHHLLIGRFISKRLKPDQAASAAVPPFLSSAASSAIGELVPALASHRTLVEQNNHGLGAKHVKQMFLPLGYRDYLFPVQLMTQLNAFKEMRGAVAHKSGAVGTSTWPTAASERAAILPVLVGLKRLEQFMPRVLIPL